MVQLINSFPIGIQCFLYLGSAYLVTVVDNDF